ncbi:MAG: SLOG family protein [Candidatus Fimenecus sp.]
MAVIGSRNLCVSELEKYLPADVTEIVSGGARGIDTCAKQYANTAGIPLTEFLPEYEKYGRISDFKS